MEYSQTGAQAQQGIDPLETHPDSSPLSTWKPKAGWAALDVRGLRQAGCSVVAIGFAALVLSRDEISFTDKQARQVLAGGGSAMADAVLRELVLAGYLDAYTGYYKIAAAHRPRD